VFDLLANNFIVCVFVAQGNFNLLVGLALRCMILELFWLFTLLFRMGGISLVFELLEEFFTLIISLIF
jgi:hypothetical protein